MDVSNKDGSVTIDDIPEGITDDQITALMRSAESKGDFHGTFEEAMTHAAGFPVPAAMTNTLLSGGTATPPSSLSVPLAPPPEEEAPAGLNVPLAGEEGEVEPKTDAAGLLGAATRGAATPIVGRGIGVVAQGIATALGATGATVTLLPLVGAAAVALTEPVAMLINRVFGTNYTGLRQSLHGLLTNLGVAEPDSKVEELLQRGVQTGGDLLNIIGPAAGAGGAAMAAARVPAAGTGASLKAPGVVENLLTGIGNTAAGPAVVGEIASEFGAEGGGRLARTGAEAVGIENPVALDTFESIGRFGGGAGGGLVEVPFEMRRLAREATSLPGMRQRTPEAAAGTTPLTRSELDPNEMMSTARGKRFQSTAEGVVSGTAELRARRHWENVEQLKGILGEFDIEVDDLGGLPDVSRPLLDNFLTTRRAALIAGTESRDDVIGVIMRDAPGPVPVPRALEYLANERAALDNIDTELAKQLRVQITEWEGAIDGRSFQDLNITKRHLRTELAADQKQVIRQDGTQILNRAYELITEEAGEFAGEVGGATLKRQWLSANRQLSDLARDLDDTSLRAIIQQGKLNPDNLTPEMITRRISSDPSDAAKVYRNLDEDGQILMRQAVLTDIAQSQDFHNLSPTQVARRIAQESERLGVVLTEDQLQVLKGKANHWAVTQRSEQVTRGLGNPRGLPTSAIPGGGSVLSAVVRPNPAMGLAGGVLGLIGMGRGFRYIEQSPHILQMFRDLADLSPGSAEAARLARIITLAIEAGFSEAEESSEGSPRGSLPIERPPTPRTPHRNR